MPQRFLHAEIQKRREIRLRETGELMLILTNYKRDARVVKVDNVQDTKVLTEQNVDVTAELIAAGILQGENATPTGYIEAGIQSDLTQAIDYFNLFGVPAVVEAIPVFNDMTETEHVGVSLLETRYERAGRFGLQEYLTYRIARFLTVPDASAATAQKAIGLLMRLIDNLANIQITQAERVFVVDSISAEPIDAEQFATKLTYCGIVDLTLTGARC